MVPHPTARILILAFALLAAARPVSAQTVVQWQANASGSWFSNANWSTSVPPTNQQRAALTTANTVTASGNASASVLAFDVNATGAVALFDYASYSYGLQLGNATSNWTTGTVEFRTSYGLYGNGIANTTVNLASGVELLYGLSAFTSARNLSNLTVNNAGTIHATNAPLSVSYASVTNQAGGLIHADGTALSFGSGTSLNNLGTIRATGANGQVTFGNILTTANLGTVDLVGGAHAYLTGTLNNASATLGAPTGGIYELQGGTISGGSIAAGAVKFSTFTSKLDGASLQDDLTLGASERLTLTGGATFTGGNATLGTSAMLTWEQSAALTSKTITLANGAVIYVKDVNSALTFGNGTTVTGDLAIYSDGSAGTAITNQGSLTHTSTSSGTIYAQSLANSGTITNSTANASLFIGRTSGGYNTTNTGTITVDASGATIYLDGNFNNTGGVLNANAGQLEFRGNNTAANLNGGTLNIATGAHAYLNGTLDNTFNNAPTTLLAPASGKYELYGGRIQGGTIAPGALTFTSSGGYLDGATLNDDLTLPASAYVRLTGGTTFTGANATLGNSSTVYWQQAGTLSGKSVTLGSNSLLYVAGGNSSLTLGSTTTVTGDLHLADDGSTNTTITNQGSLTHTDASSGSIYASTLANSGTISNRSANTTLSIGNTSSGYNTTNTGNITVNASGATVYLDGNVNNTGGVLNAIAGQLIFRGTNNTGNLNGGTLNIFSGAHAYLNGVLENVAAVLNAPASGKYELYGGTIHGGMIAPNAVTFTGNGGYLDGTTLDDDLVMPASTYVHFTGGATFAGTNATLGNSSTVYWQQAGTLAGKAITLGANSYLYVTGGNSTLTFGSSTTVTGDLNLYADGSIGTAITNQGSLTHTSSSSGSIYAPSFSNSGSIANTAVNTSLSIGSTSTGYTTKNTGTITVNASGAWVYLDGDFDNTGGTLDATAGQFSFRGNNTTGHLNGGTVNIASGAHAYLNGTLDNTSATLNAPASGAYELYGGTINNGAIAAGAVSFTSSGGTLNGVSLLGNVTLPTGSYVYWKGGTNLGSANASLTLGGNGGVYWQQNGVLAGTSLNFGSNGYLYLSGANAALTLDSATTASGDIQIYSDGSAGTALTNQGTLTHTTGSGYLYAQTFTNAGMIDVTGGTLYLGTGSTGATVANNAGATVRLNGGNLALQQLAANPLVNNGVIDIRSGTFYTNGRLTNGSTGTIQGAGVILGNLLVSGGTISPGINGIGALSVSSGALTVGSAATFAVDISGASSDQLVFQNPTGAIDLGSGLLALSINLLNAPTANSTYNIITISSGSHGILGTFAGLANSGDMLTANFNGTPFTFSINYQPNFVSLAYNPVVVPEPSTYALTALGVLVLAATRRRRRAERG
jgi:hypothetical protein